MIGFKLDSIWTLSIICRFFWRTHERADDNRVGDQEALAQLDIAL